MKIGTDFSGIGSPEAALKKLGIKHSQIFACEIDKHARKSYEAVHGKPQTFYEDITKRDHKEVQQLDLYVAGFPCQAFSMAGKRQGFEDTRGTLFFNVAEFIKINQPKCFILENVKGLLSHDSGKTFETIISVLSDNGGTVNGQSSIPYYDDGLGYHIYYKVLNTKNYGIPQNRERIFIVGFKDFNVFRFPKEMELKLRLKDMLEDDPNKKYYLSDDTIKGLLKGQAKPQFTDGNEVARCFTAGGNSGGMHSSMTLLVKTNNAKGYEEAAPGDSINFNHLNSKTKRGRVGKQISSTIDTGAVVGVYVHNIPEIKKTQYGKHQQDCFYDSNGIMCSIPAGTHGSTPHLTKTLLPCKTKIRRLTPLECWRLQGFTDEQFKRAQEVNSDTQLYKQAGNSITVNVVEEILKKIYDN